MHQAPAIVVFSHLRWDFVWQRPQHLLSRLAQTRRVVFIEEPTPQSPGEPHWERHSPSPNVLVCRQEQVIFHVHDACGVVGALDVDA